MASQCWLGARHIIPSALYGDFALFSDALANFSFQSEDGEGEDTNKQNTKGIRKEKGCILCK